MRPTRANKPDGYLLGSYRIATAPEPNSSRFTSFKSTYFDRPANNVGPWPAILGCTTNSYSSINPSSVNASASFTFALYCERNLVERFFNIIKHFRAIATRYEKTARNFLAGVHLVCALAWLK